MSDWRSRAKPVERAPEGGDSKPVSGWRSRATPVKAEPVADPGSPLDIALREQPGDVVEVQTPTGPARFDRQGRRVYGAEESQAMIDAGGARLKERALEAGLSTLSGGGPLLDELKGAVKATRPLTFWNWLADRAAGGGFKSQAQSPLDVYRSERDKARGDVAMATGHASPTVNVLGADIPVLPMAGAAVPSMLAPIPATAAARIAGSAAQGAGAAAAGSEADLTRGEAGRFLADTAVGGGLGAASAAAGEALGAPLRWGAQRLSEKAAAAKQALIDSIQRARDKAVASQRGHLGRLIATQSNSADTLMQVIANPERYSDDVVKQALDQLSSEEGRVMLDRAAANNIDKLAEAFGAEPGVRDDLARAVAAARPEKVLSEAERQLSPEEFIRDNAQKFGRSVLQRAALAAGGSWAGSKLGEAMGYDSTTGGMAGALVGGIAPGALQYARNRLASPAVQSVVSGLASPVLGVMAKGTAPVWRTGGAAVVGGLMGGMSQEQPEAMRTVSGQAGAQARNNAYETLMRRLGIAPSSDEEMADDAFIRSQTGSAPR